jgi:hypothetical protein
MTHAGSKLLMTDHHHHHHHQVKTHTDDLVNFITARLGDMSKWDEMMRCKSRTLD